MKKRLREGPTWQMNVCQIYFPNFDMWEMFPGEGGVHKHFFDRDARPRTNFNYPKNRMILNLNPKFKPQKIE